LALGWPIAPFAVSLILVMATPTSPAPSRALTLALVWSAIAAFVVTAAAATVILASTSGVWRPLSILAVGGVVLLLWLSVIRRLLRRHVEAPLASLAEARQAVGRVEKLATTGRLATGIAHEVGNPLSAIATYAHLIRTRAGGTVEVDEPLDALEREIARIERIVRGLLDYARPRRLTPKAVRVDDVLEDVLRLMTDQGVLRRITLEREIASSEAAVFAERHDLEQVFVNLLLNAVDAVDGTGRIGVRTRVVPASELRQAPVRRATDGSADSFPHAASDRALRWLARASRPDTVLQVVVADSGPGLSAEDAERVFEPFFSTKPDGRGTGLGLAIVAQTIEGVGGTIWAQTAREGGAAFVLLLPLHGAREGVRVEN
jgi:two-component system, NtrC family, sensor kinase